ncbi:DUF2079 domain-containing protein [Methylophilaceae bacterium Uisw_099_01]
MILKKDSLVVISFIFLLSLLSVLKYWSLHSSLADLGFLTRSMQAIEFGGFQELFSVHAKPLLIFYYGLYSLLDPFFFNMAVLVLQAIFLAMPAYYLLKKFGRLTVLAYILFFPLWFNALFDFHLDHLSVPLLLAFFLFAHSSRIGYAFIFAITLALVKEPFALQTGMCGIYLLAINWKSGLNLKLCLYSFSLVIFGFGYFLVVNHLIIPLYSNGIDFAVGLNSEAFTYLGANFGEAILFLFSHPLQIMFDIFNTPGKVIYLVALFGSLGFIPLLKPGPLLVALPILAISLLSQNESYYGLGHHYTAGLIAPMIFSFIGSLPRANYFWNRASILWYRLTRLTLPTPCFKLFLVIWLILAHIALAPSPIGRLFWSDKIWAYSYKAYIPTKRDTMIKEAITEFIPTDLDVVTSVQNNINWWPLLQRQNFFLFPQGVSDAQRAPFFEKKLLSTKIEWRPLMADFVVLDLKRPWFLVDKGCNWLYGKCVNKNNAKEYLGWVDKTRMLMEIVFEKDGFIILKRKKAE